MKKVKYVIWKQDGEIHKTVFDKPVSKAYILFLYNVLGYMEILYIFTIKFK